MPDVDVVVIGSGAGGLAAALSLAQAGKKVVVLEQHDVPGGWCHSFTLGGYRFSPGVHYLGELGPGGRLRALYEGLGVSGDLEFCELNPDGFDKLCIGGERFGIPKGKDELERRLADRFPAEKAGIKKYLDTAARIGNELNALFEIKGLSDLLTLPFKAPTVARWGLRSTKALLEAYVRDPRLKAVLAAQAGDHGLPPSMAPAAVHASVQAHYFDGGWYPRGGGFAIPRAFVRALKKAGGELRLKTSVDKLLVEKGRVIGVRLAGGEEIRAGAVVSNADPHATFVKLMDAKDVPGPILKKLGRTRYSVSAISLFFAAEMDLRKAGMDSANLWWYAHDDLESIYQQGMTAWAKDEGQIPGMFLTATTLKDPSKGDGRVHTMEAFAFVSHDSFKQWAHSQTGGRPQEYEQLKARLKERMLDAVDVAVPGLKKATVFSDLGTPLTNSFYCASTEGNLYGTEKSVFQVGPWAWPVGGQLPGLYLCGASTLSHGVMGATLSGLAAARAILHVRARELLTQKGPELLCVPSEKPEEWPAHLRKRAQAAAA